MLEEELEDNQTAPLNARAVPAKLISSLQNARVMSKNIKTMNKLVSYILQGIVPYLPNGLDSSVPFEQVFLEQILKSKLQPNPEFIVDKIKSINFVTENEIEMPNEIGHVDQVNQDMVEDVKETVKEKKTTRTRVKSVKKSAPIQNVNSTEEVKVEPEVVTINNKKENSIEKSLVDDMQIPDDF